MGTQEELLPAMQTTPHNEVFSMNKEPNPIERMVFNTSNSEDPIPSVDAAHDVTQVPELEFDSIYDTIVHWRKKFFQVPWGSSGKLFTAELTRLLRSYVDTGGADHQALAAFFSFPALMLQSVHNQNRNRENSEHLLRRLDLWSQGKYTQLLDEGAALQRNLTINGYGKRPGRDDAAHHFSNLVTSGRIHQATRMVTESTASGGVLGIDDTIDQDNGTTISVRTLLEMKHPPAQSPNPDILLPGNPDLVNPIQFAGITSTSIKQIDLHTQGSAGPSGLDTEAWRRICSSFKNASTSLCQALAGFTQLFATTTLDPAGLAPFVSSRLIALDKNPGVRPIGVGEVMRRIVAKAVLKVAQTDITEACGFLQKCSGMPAGIEGAVNAMRQFYEDDTTDGVLLVDASNAFNCLNRAAALRNAPHLCPSLGHSLQNSYQTPARLVVSGGGELQSCEGTTQGDPLAMAFYALATLPLLKHLHDTVEDAHQVWNADDSGAAGKLQPLRIWWDELARIGPSYGYFPNSAKTQLLVKPAIMEQARTEFNGTGITIITGGTKYLGSAIGDSQFISSFLAAKIHE